MNKKQILKAAEKMHDDRIKYLNGQIALLKDDIRKLMHDDNCNGSLKNASKIEKLYTRIELLQLLKAGAPEAILNLL